MKFVRVTLEMSEDGAALLRHLAKRDHLNREGVVRRSLLVYDAATSAQRLGAVLVLRHADGREEELSLVPTPAPLMEAVPAKG